MLQSRQQKALADPRHKLSATLLETMDNYEVERADADIGEVTLNETSEEGERVGTMIPRPMKVKERPKSVSMNNARGKSMQNSKASMDKLAWAQSLTKFEHTAPIGKPKAGPRYKGYTFGQCKEALAA